MRVVFADTSYWIAVSNPRDFLHTRARELSKQLAPVHVVTPARSGLAPTATADALRGPQGPGVGVGSRGNGGSVGVSAAIWRK